MLVTQTSWLSRRRYVLCHDCVHACKEDCADSVGTAPGSVRVSVRVNWRVMWVRRWMRMSEAWDGAWQRPWQCWSTRWKQLSKPRSTLLRARYVKLPASLTQHHANRVARCCSTARDGGTAPGGPAQADGGVEVGSHACSDGPRAPARRKGQRVGCTWTCWRALRMVVPFGHHQELPQEEKRKVESLAEHVQQLKEDLEATGVERNMTAAKLAACEEQIRNLTAGTSEARTYAAAMNEGASCELQRSRCEVARGCMGSHLNASIRADVAAGAAGNSAAPLVHDYGTAWLRTGRVGRDD